MMNDNQNKDSTNPFKKFLGKRVQTVVNVGSMKPFFYKGEIIETNNFFITINDDKDGIIDIPINKINSIQLLENMKGNFKFR